ncbi:MAG: phage integrase N-terminal SAM-like domain-containing protein [Burkholderiaceae bacterium]
MAGSSIRGGTGQPAVKSTKLLGQLREHIRYRHYSYKTETVYLYWVRQFLYFHEMRHPSEMGRVEVEAFLQHLAVQRQVAPATHRQALAALLFMYERVLGIELPWLKEIDRPQVRQRLPVVLSQAQIGQIFAYLAGAAFCWRDCSTAPACEFLRRFSCASKILISQTQPLLSARLRAEKTAL